MPTTQSPADDRRIVLEEYDLDANTVAMLFDPLREGAWLQSDVVESVDR